MWETVVGAAAVARLRAPFRQIVATELAQNRAFFRSQIEQLFAPELAAMPPTHAATVLATCDVLTSFESHQLLRSDQGRSREQTVASLVDALTVLLTTAPA